MKIKFCVLAMTLLAANVWAAGDTAQKASAPAKAPVAVTKDSLLSELNKGCLDAGNNKTACDCSINGFKEKITDEEWKLLLTPPKKVTSEQLAKYQEINAKVVKSVDECGATQTKK